MLPEVLRISQAIPLSGILKMYHLDRWRENENHLRSHSELYQRRLQLNGRMLRTAVKGELILGDQYPTGLGRNFLCSQIWFMFMKYLNFTSCYKFSSSPGNGILLTNGSWTGIMGMLQNREADVIAESISMTNSRLEVVEFIAPIWTERKYPFFKAKKIFRTKWGSFISPFANGTWMILGCVIMLITAAFVCAYRLCANVARNSFTTVFTRCFFLVTGYFLNQDQTPDLLCKTVRVLRVVTLLTSVVILAVYSGAFVSYLTLRNPVIPFSTFQELLEEGTYKLGVLRYSSLLSFLKNANDTTLKQLYMDVVAPRRESLPNSTLEGLQRVCRDPKYAHMHSLEGITKYTDMLGCQLMKPPNAKIETLKSMATVKDSPYTEVFKHMTFKIQETGILQKLRLNSVSDLPKVDPPSGAIDVKTLSPVFCVLLMGVVFSIIVISLELYFITGHVHENLIH